MIDIQNSEIYSHYKGFLLELGFEFSDLESIGLGRNINKIRKRIYYLNGLEKKVNDNNTIIRNLSKKNDFLKTMNSHLNKLVVFRRKRTQFSKVKNRIKDFIELFDLKLQSELEINFEKFQTKILKFQRIFKFLKIFSYFIQSKLDEYNDFDFQVKQSNERIENLIQKLRFVKNKISRDFRNLKSYNKSLVFLNEKLKDKKSKNRLKRKLICSLTIDNILIQKKTSLKLNFSHFEILNLYPKVSNQNILKILSEEDNL